MRDLDITIYANEDFDWQQMAEIRLGLKNEVDVSYYLNPSIGWKEMQRIRLELENNKK
jgi:hypothetical protein